MIAETKARANQIFLKLGKEDGKKHIDQIIYLCEHSLYQNALRKSMQRLVLNNHILFVKNQCACKLT